MHFNHSLTKLPLFSPSLPPPQSDSNLSHFHGNTGDTSPGENPVYSQSHAFSSPFKGDFNKGTDRDRLPDYEPFLSRSSFNLNYNHNQPGHHPVHGKDKGTVYSSDFLVRKRLQRKVSN